MVLNCTLEHGVLTAKENEEGMSSLVRHPSFVAGSANSRARAESTQESWKAEKEGECCIPYPIFS